jgi:hypothetical protein
MKKSITFAALLLVGAGATGASAALPNPYQGSDTLFNVTRQAIAAVRGSTDPTIGPDAAYIGGGSGNGQSAMAAATPTQQTAPMSRMMNNGNSLCNFGGGTAGSNDGNADGIVIGLDAVAVLSNSQTGAQTTAACNAAGNGLAASGTTGVFTGASTQNWKFILALVYGGKDLSNAAAAVDCGSTARVNLVANWGKLFQGGACTQSSTVQTSGNSGVSVCGAGSAANGALWHAFRRDEASGTSDVFSSLLGLTPSTSNSAVNGFGTSPYCNALNWDTTAGNANCALGLHDQFTGPGGMDDPASTTTPKHRKPPTGTWGDAPNPGNATQADVYPVYMQDNDPIRRTCIGDVTNKRARAAEEVCNLDGALGLVLPMVDTDWILSLAGPNNKQYPSNLCTGFATGNAPNVYTCGPRGNTHFGECPNGDTTNGGQCGLPIDVANNTSQCVSSFDTIDSGFFLRSTLGNTYGRAFNLTMRDGTTSGAVGFLQYPIPAIASSVDMTGAFNRIHQVATVMAAAVPGCQMVDMTDQIGCLTATDPCSIGYAGVGATDWTTHTNGFTGTSTDAAGTWATGPLQVAAVAPTLATVQLLGTPGEYQVSRKLYFNSLPGFGHVTQADELALAKFESVAASIDPILTTNGFFPLGAQSPAGANNPFCEDFNEKTVCTSVAANVDACNAAGNTVAGIPTANTVCGDGVVGAYEECDGTVKAGAGGCSATCRCKADYNSTTGACN